MCPLVVGLKGVTPTRGEQMEFPMAPSVRGDETLLRSEDGGSIRLDVLALGDPKRLVGEKRELISS